MELRSYGFYGVGSLVIELLFSLVIIRLGRSERIFSCD